MLSNAQIRVNFAGKDVEVPTWVTYNSKRESLLIALKTLGYCSIAALACAAVPVLQFVLAPMALLLGIIAAAFVYVRSLRLPKSFEGTVQCMHCSEDTAFNIQTHKTRLFYEMCKSCRTSYEVVWAP